ncbi:LysE family translocator [Streptomyces sp. NPDC056628]|uniref:LysE family translocator n=1 Tax=Streptomyces sp. NPDC056628 TaxID=3345882 RepID=UPI00369BBA70
MKAATLRAPIEADRESADFDGFSQEALARQLEHGDRVFHALTGRGGLAAADGLSVIAARSPLVYAAIKLAGAAYLVYLGIRAVLAARRLRAGRETTRAIGAPAARGDGSRNRWRSGFAQGFLTNVLNPKAALFFLSVLPQFVHGGGSMTRQIFLLGILDVLVGVAYWFALVAVAARLRALLDRPKIRRRWELTTGWLFIAIGVGVAAAA